MDTLVLFSQMLFFCLVFMVIDYHGFEIILPNGGFHGDLFSQMVVSWYHGTSYLLP